MLFRNLPSFSRLLKANVLVEEKVKVFCCGAQGVKIYWSEGMILSRGYPPTLLSSFSADDRTNYQEHDRWLRLGSDANSHSGQYLQNQTTTRIWCCCWCELRGLSHPGSSGMNRHDDLAAGGLLRRGQEFWMPCFCLWCCCLL